MGGRWQEVSKKHEETPKSANRHSSSHPEPVRTISHQVGKERGGDGGQASRTDRGQGGLEQEADAEEQEVFTRAVSKEDKLGGFPTQVQRCPSSESKTGEVDAVRSDASHVRYPATEFNADHPMFQDFQHVWGTGDT